MDCLQRTTPQLTLPQKCMVHYQPPRYRHLLSLDNRQKTCPQRTSTCTKQPPKADRNQALSEKCEISAKSLAVANIAAHRKYIIAFILSIIIQCVCMRLLIQLPKKTTPLIVSNLQLNNNIESSYGLLAPLR